MAAFFLLSNISLPVLVLCRGYGVYEKAIFLTGDNAEKQNDH